MPYLILSDASLVFGHVPLLHLSMDKATIITADRHLAAMQYAGAGMKEYEIIAKVKEVAYAHNASLSFNPIVTIHGETFLNLYSGKTIREGQMVLCDAGAGNDMNYAGDLTCTFPEWVRSLPTVRKMFIISFWNRRRRQ